MRCAEFVQTPRPTSNSKPCGIIWKCVSRLHGFMISLSLCLVVCIETFVEGGSTDLRVAPPALSSHRATCSPHPFHESFLKPLPKALGLCSISVELHQDSQRSQSSSLRKTDVSGMALPHHPLPIPFISTALEGKIWNPVIGYPEQEPFSLGVSPAPSTQKKVEN